MNTISTSLTRVQRFHRYLLILASILVTTPVFAQSSTTRFNLGSVPDQTIWAGSTSEILLHWDEKAFVAMTYQASPVPSGPISLVAAGTKDWQLRYTPNQNDTAPFTMTVTATSNGKNLQQSWQIEPQAVLPPEEAFFSSGPHTQAPVARYGVDITDRVAPLKVKLNYGDSTGRPINVHDIRIVGELVEIEQDHDNGLSEFFDRRDVSSIEIIAETVIIRSPLRAKQTNVSITARQLIFEGNGELITTPHEKTELNKVESKPGDDGLPAGNVTLMVGEVVGSGMLFDLTGGDGEKGGEGANGGKGPSVNTSWKSVRYCDSGICKTHTAPSGYQIIYWRYRFAGITADSDGLKNGWPEDGTDAKPSGKPGEGGDGGTLISSVPLSGKYILAGGKTPAPTRPPNGGSKYTGGAAGTPQKSEKIRFDLDFFKMQSERESSHVTKRGKDAAVVSGNTAAGEAGTFTRAGGEFAWIHPLSVGKILQHIRDDYLGDRTVAAQTRLEEYVSILSSYRAHPSWSALDATFQLDVAQQHDDMKLLLQQIEAGLDYYGNPPAWVPMLSFEVNQTLFQNELDRAMNTLYLAYWIGNKASTETERLDAMTTLRASLREQLEQAKKDYNAAVTRLPVLRQSAAALDGDIKTIQNDLEVEELKLLNDTREEDWVLGLRIGLKLSATICQMVPVYQPALGVVGEGLRAASNFNPDRPWDSIKDVKNVGQAYMDADFEDAAKEEMEASEEIDAEKAEENSIDYAKALQGAATGLAKGINDYRTFVKEQEAPSEEMLAELERLKSRSPEYKGLIERVEKLTEENAALSEEIVTTMQQIGSLSGVMRSSVLAIGALSKDIAANATVLDDRATAYLDDMERRAFDRLVKYHYYLAKAYEYRMLLPYTETLDLESLFEKFEEIAGLNTDHEITPEQFNTLKSIYEDKISNVAETIFDHYNANRPDLSVPLRFNLLPEEIDTLNDDGTVILNLRDTGFFLPDEENIRIVDIKLFAIEAAPVGGGRLGRNAFVDLNIEHSGISRLKKDGETYLFRHYTRNTDNPFLWGGRFDPIDERIDSKEISDASDSLLRSLLSGDAVNDMLLYSRPSAWADLSISRTAVNVGGPPLEISSVRLEVTYDFTPRPQSTKQRDLEVLVEAISTPGGPTEPSSLAPYFEVNAMDTNGRDDARGNFLRVFNTTTGSVSVSAPPTYGQWTFVGWKGQFGQELPGGPYPSPTFNAPLAKDTVLVAQYDINAEPPVQSNPLWLDAPTLQGNQITLRWSGGLGIKLQTLEDLQSGAWQDVQGSDGLSTIQLPKRALSQFFRVVR